MTMPIQFADAFSRSPLIAILRGVRPYEAEEIGEALVEAGFTLIEVPLNSPDPIESITRLARRLRDRAIVGAGTVLRVDDVEAVASAGGQLIVSPNTDSAVIERTVALGLTSLPGYFTPTEAFRALEAGAHGLKFFPADETFIGNFKSQQAVIPKNVPLFVVGGITPDTMATWRSAGACGFGLGRALYTPDMSVAEVTKAARRFLGHCDRGSKTAISSWPEQT